MHHRDVAIITDVTSDEDRAFVDAPVYADWLALLVVDRLYLKQTPDHEPATYHCSDGASLSVAHE